MPLREISAINARHVGLSLKWTRLTSISDWTPYKISSSTLHSKALSSKFPKVYQILNVSSLVYTPGVAKWRIFWRFLRCVKTKLLRISSYSCASWRHSKSLVEGSLTSRTHRNHSSRRLSWGCFAALRTCCKISRASRLCSKNLLPIKVGLRSTRCRCTHNAQMTSWFLEMEKMNRSMTLWMKSMS